jgi:hypothetical protein
MATKTKAQRKPKPTTRKPAARAATPPSRRPRQLSVPGTEGPRIPELDAAAEAYVDVRDTRMGWTKKETAAQGTLLTCMTKHGLHAYRLEDGGDPMLVTIVEGKAKVSVRKEKPAAAAPDDEDGDREGED